MGPHFDPRAWFRQRFMAVGLAHGGWLHFFEACQRPSCGLRPLGIRHECLLRLAVLTART